MVSTKLSLLSLTVGLLGLTTAQCPNEVALYHPNLRTQTDNGTWFLVPVPSTAVQKALDETYGSGVVLLASVPTTDKSLFPSGFPKNNHPILANSFLSDNIRMSAFQINGALLGGQVYAPYVRRPSSKPGTLLTAEISSYLSGPDNKALPGLVPSTVSTLVEGFPTRLGHFQPDDAAYQLNSGGVLSNTIAWTVAPNPVSGPGIYPEVLDMQYSAAPHFKQATAEFFKTALNQPAILAGVYLANNTCQRDTLYFNNATGVMLPRTGNVTFGPAADGSGVQKTGVLQGASPDGSGFFSGLTGFSACVQNVGYNPQDCDQAAKEVE